MRKPHVLVLTLCVAAAPCLAQSPSPPPDAEAVSSAVQVTRLLRGINRAGFTSEQGAALVKTGDAWDAQRKAARAESAGPLSQAAASLRASVAQVEKNPSEPVDAETAYQAAVQRSLAREAAVRQAARDQFLRLLTSLGEAQTRALAAVAREGMLAERMEDGSRTGPMLTGMLAQLDRLRSAPPAEYARMRDMASQRLAGGFVSVDRASRPGGPGPRGGLQPPAPDPAAAQRAAQIAAFFDRARALSAQQWQMQRDSLAAQLVRERHAVEINAVPAEVLFGYFVDEYLLQEASPAALRLRFAPDLK